MLFYFQILLILFLTAYYFTLRLLMLQSSNTLGFMLYLLASHPEKQEKLRAEILEHSDHLDIHVVKNLKYLNMCIKETLRLYPILFINGRTIRKDFVSQKGIQFKAEVRNLGVVPPLNDGRVTPLQLLFSFI